MMKGLINATAVIALVFGVALAGTPIHATGHFDSYEDIAAAARDGAKAGLLTPHHGKSRLPAHYESKADAPITTPLDEPMLGMKGFTETNLQPLFDIPIVLNDEVIRVIEFYSQGNGRGHFGRYLARSHRWIPMMHDILRSYDLPLDLVYVAMIESGFFMRAYSHAQASGPWQFIASTADIYALRMDPWIDERRDPEKATHAAAKYLTWLYREFEDWELAWAGYNGGPTRVRRAMNRTGLENYWDLCEAGRLPRETCGYVPKIMAAAIISRFPARFGFDEVEPQPPFEYETVEVEQPVELQAIAALIGFSLDEVRALNPELRRALTPPSVGGTAYTLRLPPGTREAFMAGKDDLEPSTYLSHESHTVRRGESFWAIARSYGTSVDALRAANPGVEPRALRPGFELLVPLPAGSRPAVPSSREETPSESSGRVVQRGGGFVEVHYTVRPGDSLWSIAQRHGATTDQLASWNGIRTNRDHVHLSVGQRLIVGRNKAASELASGRVHILQAGDTLWQLSRRFGISVEKLKELNGIDDPQALMPGQTLVIGR